MGLLRCRLPSPGIAKPRTLTNQLTSEVNQNPPKKMAKTDFKKQEEEEKPKPEPEQMIERSKNRLTPENRTVTQSNRNR